MSAISVAVRPRSVDTPTGKTNRIRDNAPRGEEIRRALKLGYGHGFLGREPEPHPSLGFRPGGILDIVYRQAWQLGQQGAQS